MNPNQAGAYPGFAAQTLARWRIEVGGPQFLKSGARIRYGAAVLIGSLLERSVRGGVSLSSPFLPLPDMMACRRPVARPPRAALGTLGVESPPLVQRGVAELADLAGTLTSTAGWQQITAEYCTETVAA